MKKTLLSILLLGIGVLELHAQTPLPDTTVANTCTTIANDNLDYLTPANGHYRLASRYTFRNLIKNDFSTITIADNTATVGQFAALSIDPNTYKLAFSPYAWSPQGKDLATKDFKDVFAINVTGTLSNQSLLNLKDWRTVTGSFSYTHVLGENYKYAKTTAKTAEEYRKPYKEIYTDITNQMLDQLDRAYDPVTREVKSRITLLNHPEFLKKEDLKQAYLDSVSRYEQLLTNSEWKNESILVV